METEKTAAERIKAYIKEHLQDSITSGDIAKAAGYSQYHATKLFKAETGLSPFEYIRRERLIKSAHVLRSGNSRVLDVALDFVFNSHEGFTRAFTKAFGLTPKMYAGYNSRGDWLIPFRYLDRRKLKPEVDNMKETAVIFTQIVERPARKLILKRSRKATEYFEYCEEFPGCDEGSDKGTPWETLSGIKEALYEPVGVWLPGNMCPEGTGIYAHGVEVAADYAGKIPDGFDVIDLVPCKLMVFQGETYDDEELMEHVGACMERIEKFNPEVYGYQYARELAPRMQLAPMGWRGYIEMRPIKERNG
jgi:AraC-like DNA-binding protein